MNALEYGIGLDIVLFFHEFYQPFNAWFWQFMHVIGGEKGFLIMLPFIYWAIDKKLGIRLFILIMSGATLMNITKLWFSRPRPFEAAPNLFEQTVHQSGYGLPSGHVWLSLLLAGFIALYYYNKRNIAAACIWVGLMGISRMVLGVHYLQDVILGMVLGGINLWIFTLYYSKLSYWFKIKPMLTKSLYLIVFMLVVQFFAVLLGDVFELRKSLLAGSGVLCGGVLGLIISDQRLNFNVTGLIQIKIVRIVFGLILMTGFYVLISFVYYALFNNPESLLSNVFYQVRYALIGLWATFCVPFVLVKCRLLQITTGLK